MIKLFRLHFILTTNSWLYLSVRYASTFPVNKILSIMRSFLSVILMSHQSQVLIMLCRSKENSSSKLLSCMTPQFVVYYNPVQFWGSCLSNWVFLLPEMLYIHRMTKYSDKNGRGMKKTPRERNKGVRLFFSDFLENQDLGNSGSKHDVGRVGWSFGKYTLLRGKKWRKTKKDV